MTGGLAPCTPATASPLHSAEKDEQQRTPKTDVYAEGLPHKERVIILL